MKKRILSLLLVIALMTSMAPASYAAGRGNDSRQRELPDAFLKKLSLPLVEARTSGLYDQPEQPLPDAAGQGFLQDVDGWIPAPAGDGLPLAVEEPDAAATPVSTVEDLKEMEQGGSFVLTQDIDLTDTDWQPLYVDGDLTLDGQGYAIRGFSCTVTHGENAGFFSRVEGTLTVKNLCWDDVTLTHNYTAASSYGHGIGSLAGNVRRGSAILQNVSAKVDIVQAGTLQSCSGGLIGSADEGLVMEDCSVTVTYRRAETAAGMAVESDEPLGGIAGTAADGSVLERVYAEVEFLAEELEDQANIGGLFGETGDIQIKDTFICGTIAGNGHCMGGIVGETRSELQAENCVAELELSGGAVAGGYTGKLQRYGKEVLTDCRFTGSIMPPAAQVHVGGLVGEQESGSLLAEGCSVELTVLSPAQEDAESAVNGAIGGIVGHTSSSSYDCIRCVVVLNADGLHNDGISMGGLSGSEAYGSHGTGEDCYADVYFRNAVCFGNTHVGGMMGLNRSGTLKNCGAQVRISVESGADCSSDLGGLVGYSDSGVQISRCYATGSVRLDHASQEDGTAALGGLVGSGSTGAATTITQCYANAIVAVKNSHLVNGTAVGGLAGDLSNHGMVCSSWSDAMLSCDNDEETNDYGDEVHACCVGGLVGSGGTGVMDSAFIGTMTICYGRFAGGIQGWGGRTFRNCYAETNLSTGKTQGGICGGCEKAFFYDCAYKGMLRTAEDSAGGIVGTMNGGGLYRCQVASELDAENAIVGGLAGDVYKLDSITDCSFDGAASGAIVGGIVGQGHSDVIRNCTVDAMLDQYTGDGVAIAVGGIVGRSTYDTGFENCHMKQKIVITGELETLGQHYVGGISGYGGGRMINCSSKGVSIRGNDPFDAYAGGIVGQTGSDTRIENCQVDGGVSAKSRTGGLYVGGIAGKIYGSVIKNCSVTGSVSGAVSPDEEEKDPAGVVYAGGIVGDGGAELFLNKCYHIGKANASSTSDRTVLYELDPLVGDEEYEDQSVGSMDTPDRGDETYFIQVCWYPERSELGNNYLEDGFPPLEGAVVTVDGQPVGVTNADGIVTVHSSEIPNSANPMVKAQKEGYYDEERSPTLAKNGILTLYMKKKTPGTIYLRSAVITVSENSESSQLIGSKNTIWVDQTQLEPMPFAVTVDWNDIQTEGRELYLIAKESGHRIDLAGNVEEWICLPEVFDPGEKIWLRATGVDPEGQEREAEALLPLQVRVVKPYIHPKPVQIEFGDEDGLYFMDGFELGLDFGNLSDQAASIAFENGICILTYQIDVDGKDTYSIDIFNDSSVEVGVQGELQIPYDIANGKMLGTVNGYVGSALNHRKPESEPGENEDPMIRYEYNFQTAVCPILMVLEMDMAATFGAGVEGVWDDLGVLGNLTGEGAIKLTGGPGVSYGEAEISGRIGGEAVLTLPIEYHGKGSKSVTFDPELEGYLIGCITVKAWDLVDLDEEVRLGGFKWSKDGTEWYTFTGGWEKPVSRNYLANGGGFSGEAELSLLGWTDRAEGEQQTVRKLYENILSDSRGALTVENGTVVLYFTADDGDEGMEGIAAEHTALWRSELQSDGSWAEPAVVAASELGYPAMPQADGPYAVWVNSPETDSLDGLMTSTEILVAGEGEIVHRIDGDGYVYAPDVTASEDGEEAVITWLSDETVNGSNLMPADPVLHYAVYDGRKWTQGVVDTQGHTIVRARPLWEGKKTILWETGEGRLMKTTGNVFDEHEELLSNVKNTAVTGDYAVSMTTDGVLTVWKDKTVETIVTTGGNALSSPLLVQDDAENLYAVWAQADGIWYADSATGWKHVKRVCETAGMATGLSAVVVDGLPVVSYYCVDQAGSSAEETVVSLFVAQAADLAGVDLSLTGLIAVEDDLAKRGILDLRGSLTNLRETAAAGFAYAVTDEDGNVVCADICEDVALEYDDGAVCRALFVPDVTEVHRYTLTVVPLDADGQEIPDFDPANNSMSIDMKSKGAIADTGFLPYGEKTATLEAMVTNAGAAPVESMTVEVYRVDRSLAPIGDALVSETFADVYAGSYRQVLLENVNSNVYYKVVLSDGNEVLDESLLMWVNEEATDIQISHVSVEARSASVELARQGDTSNALMMLAFYDSTTGQLSYTDTKQLDGAYSAEFRIPASVSGQQYAVFVVDKDTFKPLCDMASR